MTEEQQNNPIKSYRQKKIRFIELALLSLALFGNQYAFNNPQSLQQSFQSDLNINQTEFNFFLYSLFQFPNIIVALIIGYLIDRIGVRIALIVLTTGVMIFQIIVALGAYYLNFSVIVFGRVMFGMSSGSLFTAQACMISYWFKGRQLAFALGIATTFPQFGNALNSYISPLIYDQDKSLSSPLFFSVFVCFVSLICTLIAVMIDKKAQNYDSKNSISEMSESSDLDGSHEPPKLKDILKFRLIFWILIMLCVIAVALYEPFLDNVNRLFMERFCFKQMEAGKEVMITYIVAAVVSAPLGLLIDKIGFRRYFIILTMSIFVFGHSILLFYPQCTDQRLFGAVWGLILIGICYALYANCILASIPLVVSKKVTGTAFGIMHMGQAISLSVFPIISGSLIGKQDNKSKGYYYSSMFFFIVSLVGFIISLSLLFTNKKSKMKLDRNRIKKLGDYQRQLVENKQQKNSSSEQDVQIQLTNKTKNASLGNYFKID